eukprot:5358690-Pleurochrysis_carterae.AAC.1
MKNPPLHYCSSSSPTDCCGAPIPAFVPYSQTRAPSPNRLCRCVPPSPTCVSTVAVVVPSPARESV